MTGDGAVGAQAHHDFGEIDGRPVIELIRDLRAFPTLWLAGVLRLIERASELDNMSPSDRDHFLHQVRVCAKWMLTDLIETDPRIMIASDPMYWRFTDDRT